MKSVSKLKLILPLLLTIFFGLAAAKAEQAAPTNTPENDPNVSSDAEEEAALSEDEDDNDESKGIDLDAGENPQDSEGF